MTDRDVVFEFLRTHRLAVEASTAADGAPQAAVVGVAVSDRMELVFDTLRTSRKCQNLRRDPRVALVLGWDLDEGCTLQLEGVADEPAGDDRTRLQAVYLATFVDGVERAGDPAITYFRVRPTWLRLSDFRTKPPTILEVELTWPPSAPVD
ncbi:MAG TPA: pyridoxamine 5'-phosphate oxidase family protein [Kofleriaceae bacterium]|nr:pyridoxamine 5'-phosphate oxidase family protein [Kofleriaceae bacterium]